MSVPVFNVWVETTGCGTVPLNLIDTQESLAIATLNTFPPVSQDPFGGLFMLVVNGAMFVTADGSFTLSGRQITWVSTVFAVNPGDIVIAIYSYMG